MATTSDPSNQNLPVVQNPQAVSVPQGGTTPPASQQPPNPPEADPQQPQTASAQQVEAPTGQQTAQRATGQEQIQSSSVSWLVGWVVGGLIVALIVMGWILHSSNKKTDDDEIRPKGGKSAVVRQEAPSPTETPCQDVPEFPSGRTGDFCSSLKAGVQTKLIKPVPYTLVQVLPTVPIEIHFFDDWDEGKLTGKVKLNGTNRNPSFPPRWTSFIIVAEKDGQVRMRSGMPRINIQ